MSATTLTSRVDATHPVLSPVTFAYFDNLSTVPLATPSEPDRVSRISWTLVAEADVGYRDETLSAGAAFTARPEAETGDGDQADPLKPLLCASMNTPVAPACGPVPAAATGKFEGVNDPVLQWVDPTPTLTQGWTIWRIANPEGMSGTDPARTTWAWQGVTAAAQTWYEDTTLPDGYTAQYVVRATVATGVGPESNQVITGNRPATTITRANGATTQVAVDWDTVVGATGYDVYRDGVLARSVTTGSTLTWTDTVGQSGWTGDGYGHSHYYRVVPVNRWENRLTIGTDAGRLALGSALGNYPVGGGRLASVQNPASGDFTAPAKPSFTATANANRTSTISWTAAAWVGSGPTTGRETGWLVQYQSSNEANTNLTGAALPATTFSYVHASRPTGRWSEYRVLGLNASGTGESQSHTRKWQRPATPTCSVVANSTRSITIGAGAIAATNDETYATYQTRIASGGWVPNGTATDPLYDNTTYGFRVRVQGAGSGLWSDEGSCDGTTQLLSTPGAPTCNVWSDDTYVSTTVRWSSNWPLSRSSVWATSAGYYSATATATISDGYNSNSSSNSCGISVAAPPPPSMSAGCASGTVSASPTPGVSWVFLNLCDATTTAILQSVYTAEFEGRSYNNVGIPGGWVNAKYTSYQGRMSVTNSIVSMVEIRVRLTDDWGRVSPWYTVTKTV